jgi:predicted DNA-binding transcriptional regulator AlpA
MEENQRNPEELIGPVEVANIIGISRPTLAAMIADGRIFPPLMVTPQIRRWKLGEVLAYVKKREAEREAKLKGMTPQLSPEVQEAIATAVARGIAEGLSRAQLQVLAYGGMRPAPTEESLAREAAERAAQAAAQPCPTATITGVAIVAPGPTVPVQPVPAQPAKPVQPIPWEEAKVFQ